MLSTNLRNLREKEDLTQKQIADALGLDRSTYSYYETGKSYPTLPTLIRLAKIFNTTTDELLDVSSTLTVRESRSAYNQFSDNSGSLSALSSAEVDIILKYRQLPESLKQDVQKHVEDCLKKSDM